MTVSDILSLDGRSLLATLLRHEAASALALARLGQIDLDAAQSIANTCKPELFSLDTLLRDTLHFESSGGVGMPPLMQALQETVQLFNPQAAQGVFLGGQWPAMRHNALVCLTHEIMRKLQSQLQNLLLLPEPQLRATVGLQQAGIRLHDTAQRALRLQLPLAITLIPDQQPNFMSHLAEQLQLPGEAALPSTAAADDWAALGSELGILMMATGRTAAQTVAPPWPKSAVDTALAQARRAPLLVAQWMNETCSFDAPLSEPCAFWQHRLPLWSTLATEAALGLSRLIEPD
jgi:hypothetical protein